MGEQTEHLDNHIVSPLALDDVMHSVRSGFRHLRTMRPTAALKLKCVITGQLSALRTLGLISESIERTLKEEADAAYLEGKQAREAARAAS
ncbi:hypothetical protein [Pseudomonas sp. NPDC096950]|uniref:hypothetical protein n=1 Tax=Pseudomonas sp. NPDC096950 TaxID=3364485 RepID=UPI00383B6CE7